MPYIAYGLVFVLLLLVNIEAFAQLSGVPGATVSETIQPINGTAPITISAQLGTVSPSSIGTSGPVTGASATYSYTIPANAQVGSIITDTVTIQSFPSTSFPTTLTISTTVLPPPTTNTTTPTTPTTPTQSNLTNTPLQAPCAALQTRQQAGQSLSPGQTDLLSTCSTVSSLPSSQAGGAIQQLTPVQVTAQSTLALTASNQQFRNVFSRLSLLRHGAKGVDVSGLNVRSNGQVLPAAFSNALVPGHTTGGGASSDKESPFDKFGVFVNGNFSVGDKNQTNQELGFNFNSQGVTTGIDYRITDNFILGTAFGYNGTNSGFDQSRGGVNIDGYNFSLYSTYYVKDFYVDGMLTGGWNAYDTRRQINFGTINQTGQGNTRGNEYAANLSAGYDFHYKSLTAGPYGRVSYQNNQIDGYQESATVPLSPGYGSLLSIGSQSAQSTRTAVGGQLSYALSTKHGVFTPTARAEWLHEYNNGSKFINARYINDPSNAAFSISSDSPDRNFFNLGSGVSATLAHGASAFMFYEAMVGNNNLTQHSISAGIRSEF
ncbi:MAG: autotransporter outer membrane beta-barrel domain-containing protein [Methylococcaceae bacterium]